jgi:predicted RNA binding protein YcfA (HicA-like mRNA interferase family)
MTDRQTLAPPPMQVVTKGWWTLRDEEATADELEKADKKAGLRPRDAGKLIRDLKVLSAEHGIEVSALANNRGSHRGLIIRDPKTGESITLVIPGQKTISPGIQRSIIKYVARLAESSITTALRTILHTLFK